MVRDIGDPGGTAHTTPIGRAAIPGVTGTAISTARVGVTSVTIAVVISGVMVAARDGTTLRDLEATVGVGMVGVTMIGRVAGSTTAVVPGVMIVVRAAGRAVMIVVRAAGRAAMIVVRVVPLVVTIISAVIGTSVMSGVGRAVRAAAMTGVASAATGTLAATEASAVTETPVARIVGVGMVGVTMIGRVAGSTTAVVPGVMIVVRVAGRAVMIVVRVAGRVAMIVVRVVPLVVTIVGSVGKIAGGSAVTGTLVMSGVGRAARAAAMIGGVASAVTEATAAAATSVMTVAGRAAMTVAGPAMTAGRGGTIGRAGIAMTATARRRAVQGGATVPTRLRSRRSQRT